MKNTVLSILLSTSTFVFAQTGVNTQYPQATFHVDGNKDNLTAGTPSASQQANDFVVTSEGYLGVGTDFPSTNLQINSETAGAIKINDGTQGLGKILTSDANGVGTWMSNTVTSITGDCPSVATSYGISADKYMSANISLPIGKWFIFLGFLVHGADGPNLAYASRLTFSSSNTVDENKGFTFINDNSLIITQNSNGNTMSNGKTPSNKALFGMFSSGIIRVEATSPVILYLWDKNTRFFTDNVGAISLGFNAENYLFAIKAD